MPNAVVLGAGMVGSVMAVDMAASQGWNVTVADARSEALRSVRERARRAGVPVKTFEADLSRTSEVRRVVAKCDIALGALSSRIAFKAMKTVLEAGRHFSDISFMAEDARELDALARRKGVTAVVDMGVAPGMSHVCAAEGARRLDRCERIEMYVGGLPRERRWPYDYKAAFSPYDVIEEYTRPARLMERGREVVREALSEPELMDFDGVGTLEAFNTDGLRSLVGSKLAPDMKEKTLRYPGHIALMRAMRETGLFSEEPVKVGATSIVPRAVTAALMFPKWQYKPGEEDLTVMRVLVAGKSGKQRLLLQWDLLDLYDRPTGATSMARTTAFPCTTMARLIGAGRFRRPGVFTPERVVASRGVFDTLIQEQASRGVRYRFSRRSI